MPDTVSVVITCYNHGKYLAEAIESVLSQTYKSVEIVVVDDGSIDNTKEVAKRYPGVKYVYQKNQGLSAARNTGIDHSSGEYIVFLDADDWFLPGALKTNVEYLKRDPGIAFVSGSYEMVYIHNPYTGLVENPNAQYEERHVRKAEKIWVKEDHYKNFLRGNYVVMHAAVLYRRWVFDEFRYDTQLKACEDYNLYLGISRKYPVLDHSTPIAAYRFHASNMSYNSRLMLNASLSVLERQLKDLKNEEEKACYEKGIKFWKDVYAKQVYIKFTSRNFDKKKNYSKEESDLLWSTAKDLYIKYLIKTKMMVIKKIIKSITPGFILRALYKAGAFKSFTPLTGRVSMGDLERTRPFSLVFGYDRGGPVDRYYIENFLQKNAAQVKGRVLEIGDNEYTVRFGGSKVSKSDILHVDENNKQATFIGDLSNAPQLPGSSFDCIILTQTLHLIYDFKGAIKTCYRILKPGGTLLLTVPGITHIDQGEWQNIWLWAFTKASITKILNETFPEDSIDVNTYGNVMIASAFLYGMGVSEIKKKDLDETDPHYQVIITATATKPL